MTRKDTLHDPSPREMRIDAAMTALHLFVDLMGAREGDEPDHLALGSMLAGLRDGFGGGPDSTWDLAQAVMESIDDEEDPPSD